MNKYFFRGLLKDENDFAYGGVLQGHGEFSVIFSAKTGKHTSLEIEKRVVRTDTLGQYVQVDDKNNKMIFEGDVVKVRCSQLEYECCGAVVFDDGAFYIKYRSKNSNEIVYHQLVNNQVFYSEDGQEPQELNYSYEVLGNIYQNPELLKESEAIES